MPSAGNPSDSDPVPNRKQYSGDVTLDGSHPGPVHLEGTDDTYVLTGAVDGDLRVENPEYVYTQQPTGGTAEFDTPQTKIAGALEDGYVNTTTDSVVLSDVEDVFIPHNAVTGTIEVVGAENIFIDDHTLPQNLERADTTVSGWQQTKQVASLTDALYVTGAQCEVAIDNIRHGAEIYVVGYENSVRVEGGDVSVDVHTVGRDNTVSVGSYITANQASNTGSDNQITQDEYPIDDLIDTTKPEAFSGFGSSKLAWQEPADKDRCPNCGTRTTAVIERHSQHAWLLFGYPVKTYDSGNVSYECKECTHTAGDVGLTDDEYQQAVR